MISWLFEKELIVNWSWFSLMELVEGLSWEKIFKKFQSSFGLFNQIEVLEKISIGFLRFVWFFGWGVYSKSSIIRIVFSWQ